MDRDVVLVTVDALRADHVSPLSDTAPPTPELARFAERSLVCANAFAGAPYTRGSFPAIMTGGHERCGTPVAERPHVAETFADAGYVAAGIHSNPHLAAGTHYERGFDSFEDGLHPSGGRLPSLRDLRQGVERLLGTYEPYMNAETTTDRAIARLDALDGEAPRFLWVHYMDPHAPYRPRSGTESGSVGSRRSQRLWEHVREGDAAELSADQLATIRTLYRGEVEYLDREFGRLWAHIQRRCDDPMVLVAADHGELLGGEGSLGHPNSLHESLVHVPMAVRGLGRSGRCADPVSACDILPTLCEGAGIDPPAAQGRPIQSLDGERRVVFAQSGVVGESLRVMATDGRHYLRRDVASGTDRCRDRTAGESPSSDDPPPWLVEALDGFVARITGSGGTAPQVDDAVAERLADLGYT